ncbi:type II secretion system protein GspN [Bdellovibrionota bacterium]
MKLNSKTLSLTLYGVILFLIFVYLTFPFDLLKDKIFTTIQSQTGLTIEAEKVSPLLIGGPGISFSQTTLEGTIPNLNYRISPPLKLKTLRVGISPLSLMMLHPKVKIGTNIFGGGLKVHAKFKDFFKTAPQTIWFDVDDFKLENLINIPINLNGDISIKGSITGEINNPKSLSGDLAGKIKDIKLQKGTYQGFEIPELTLKNGSIKGTLLNGELTFEEFYLGTPSEDLHLIVDGKIRLGRRLQFSQADLILRFKLSEKLKGELKSLLPLIQSALKQDGYHAFMIRGRLGAGLPLPVPLP